MVPPEQALVLQAQAIYLDTQPLVEGNFPSGTTRLRELMTLARGRGIPVFVPAPVLQELERQFEESVEEANEAIRRADKSVRKVGVQRETELLDVNRELAQYRERVNAALTALHMTRVPVTSALVAELFERAVARGRPFHAAGGAKDAGFKDAVILRSICDHVEQRQLRTVMFITADRDHQGTHNFHDAAPLLSRLTLSQAVDAMRSTGATVEQVTNLRNRLALASDAAERELNRLGQFIAEQVEVSHTPLPSTGDTVTGVMGATALSAHAIGMFPLFGDVSVGEDVEVTLYVGVLLDVLTERPIVPDLPADATPQERFVAELAARSEIASATVRVLSDVEVRLERTGDGYRNLRPTAARLVGESAADEEASRVRWDRWRGALPRA